MEDYNSILEESPSQDVLPGEKYESQSYCDPIDAQYDMQDGVSVFPIFETKYNIFCKIPSSVWRDQKANHFLHEFANVFAENLNPDINYSPIIAQEEDSFFVLEWLFPDKRFSFFFGPKGDNKYSIMCYNAKNKTFINSVKELSHNGYKEIAKEVLSYVS